MTCVLLSVWQRMSVQVVTKIKYLHHRGNVNYAVKYFNNPRILSVEFYLFRSLCVIYYQYMLKDIFV